MQKMEVKLCVQLDIKLHLIVCHLVEASQLCELMNLDRIICEIKKKGRGKYYFLGTTHIKE